MIDRQPGRKRMSSAIEKRWKKRRLLERAMKIPAGGHLWNPLGAKEKGKTSSYAPRDFHRSWWSDRLVSGMARELRFILLSRPIPPVKREKGTKMWGKVSKVPSTCMYSLKLKTQVFEISMIRNSREFFPPLFLHLISIHSNKLSEGTKASPDVVFIHSITSIRFQTKKFHFHDRREQDR